MRIPKNPEGIPRLTLEGFSAEVIPEWTLELIPDKISLGISEKINSHRKLPKKPKKFAEGNPEGI